MSATIRGLVGLGALGGVAGGGYLLHRQLSADNIGKKLEANGYKLLSETEDSVWTKILEHYKGRIEAGKKDLQFDDFDGKTPPSNTTDVLKSKCKKVLAEVTGNEENYKKAERWCTLPKPLTEILEKKGYRILKSDAAKDDDPSEWDKKLEAYDKSDETSKKFSDLDLKAPSKNLEKDAKTRNKLKEKCKALKDKKHYEKDFETELDKSILWCAIQVKKAE
ncbi:hypothetical protein A6V39_00125 [Candidatus Mycoplasma haematobovis]|uniref:Uncharacterized protein n=1 Tax=Candidatus Mycoplasma haematobovis TaxID=432608 RepID=A0A1A9QES0_9MOLU|nr:hypothetical protein [Candidatus Mycoplasma haematobovis]OAL10455.1 hypothetical protein A6V39_00125 [Candidatus Mycoplasma haematobovis]